MAKVKVTLDSRQNCRDKDGKYPLVLRISHKSRTRDIGFDIHLYPELFNPDKIEFKGIHNAVRNTKRVQKVYADIDLWLDENKAEIKLWDISKLKDKIERKFFKKQSELMLFEHAADLFTRFRLKGKYSTIASYEDALKVFVKFNLKRQGKNDRVIIKSLFSWDRNKDEYRVLEDYQLHDFPIKAIDKDFAKRFEAYMSNRFNAKNSVFIHLRSIQSIISDAEDSFDELKGHKPFEGIKKVSLPNKPVVLTKLEIGKIRSLKSEFDRTNPKYHAINYFLFMFNNMGMNFMDLALAKVGWFDGERFNYTRKKTEEEGDNFSIKQNEENIEIIDFYKEDKKPDQYLFPLIPEDTPEERVFRVKGQKAKWFNDHFTEIANHLGIEKNITTYTARDTWTNMGLGLGIDIRKISKGLGHARVETTEKHYEQNMQFNLLDEMNAWITGSKEP